MRLFLIFPLLLTLNSCRQPTPVEKGKDLFAGFGCVNCHRIGSEGGVYGPDLSFVGFRKSKEWLNLWLKNPHGWKANTVMPNFNLNNDLRGALVEYLATLKGQAFEADGRPWNDEVFKDDSVQKGNVLFERAGCVACHGKEGKGGYPNNNVVGGLIPTLAKVAEGYSKEELKDKIRKGIKSEKADPKGAEPMISMPAWGEVLADEELDALVEYLFSLKPKTSPGEEW